MHVYNQVKVCYIDKTLNVALKFAKNTKIFAVLVYGTYIRMLKKVYSLDTL